LASDSPFVRLVRRLGPALGPQLGGLGRVAGPAARLAQIDIVVLRAWVRCHGPVRDALGDEEAEAYSKLVVAAAERDPEIGRITAYTLPDHLARVAPVQRGRYLKLLRAVLADRPEAAPLVIRTLPDLLDRLDDQALSRYLAQGLQLHRESAVKAESYLRLESNSGQREVDRLQKGVMLNEVRRTLSLYARAHCGTDVAVLPVTAGGRAFTDGKSIFLPAQVDRFGDERDRLVYRVLTARNAGYLEFGTLDLDLGQVPGEWPQAREGELEIERFTRGFSNSSIAKDLFAVYEDQRVEARVRAEYPGVARDMLLLQDAWRGERPEVDGLAPAEQAVERLQRVALGMPAPHLANPAVARAADDAVAALDLVRRPGATVLDTARAVQAAFPAVYGLLRLAEPSPNRPGAPDGPGGGGRDRNQQNPVGSDDPRQNQPNKQDPSGRGPESNLDYNPAVRDPFSGELRSELATPEQRAAEDRARALLDALRARGEEGDLQQTRKQVQADGSSYEEMADFLDRMEAPSGPLRDVPPVPRRMIDALRPADGVELSGDKAPKTWLYPEWDNSIDDYKPRWVRVTEYHLKPGTTGFVEQVRRDHGPLIAQVRRSFEALRPEALRIERGVTDGDEIDIDRAVNALVERRAGGSPDDRIYTRRHRNDRDVAVAFLVDLSSSTNELAGAHGKRIIDVEKEALVVIAEAVDAIGDACAIYGFSGYGRDQVAFYVAKDFDDGWDDKVRERVGRMSWKMENRDGAAIRHATVRLNAHPARVKLLLILSDGKPLDCGCDHYADRYAHDDTRMALTEARKKGIHPFCITVDPAGQQYLERMYGEGGYTVIDRVEGLPRRLPLIYRRMTR
jgi:nitric oxide reductase NorD protein